MMVNHPFTSTYVIKNRPFAIAIADPAHPFAFFAIGKVMRFIASVPSCLGTCQ
jgi:hypothetical protein